MLQLAGIRHDLKEYPKLRQIQRATNRKWYLIREVRIGVVLPEISAPLINWDAGPMVKLDDVDFERGRSFHSYFASYPSRALRAEQQGRLLAECQIQEDSSVTCRKKTFKPESGWYAFEHFFEQRVSHLRSQAFLRDGSEAHGARFEARLTWMLGD